MRPISSRVSSGRCATPMRVPAFTGPGWTRPASAPTPSARLDDLQKLPLTTGEDLRDGYPFPFRAVPYRADRAHPRLQRHHRQAQDPGLHPEGYRRLAAFFRPLLRDGRGHAPGPGADRRGLRRLDRGGGLPAGRARSWGPWPCRWGRATSTCTANSWWTCKAPCCAAPPPWAC